MAESLDDFETWLRKKLTDLNADEDVLAPYIKGILESDDPLDEKEETLNGILADLIECNSNLEEVCSEIMRKWSECTKANSEPSQNGHDVKTDFIEDKLSKLMEKSAATAEIKKPTMEQKKLKEAILAQYSTVSDEEEVDDDDDLDIPIKNQNAENVLKAEKEKREKDKEAAKNKKEKDKEDRAKQKAKAEERKEKEKKRTQKGERRCR